MLEDGAQGGWEKSEEGPGVEKVSNMYAKKGLIFSC